MIRRALYITAGFLMLAAVASLSHAIPWPYVPFDATHGLGNHFGEYQNYGGSPYYHDGLDLVTPSGPIMTYSVSDGTVTHITVNEPYYSGIMIGEPVAGGTGWLYWHINSTTFQFDVGDPVDTYDYIGTTAYWPVANFHHTHFNKVRGTGGYPWNWYEAIDNPLLELVPNTDPDPPVFEVTYNGKIFAFARQGTGTMLDPVSLSGDVDIISRIKDIVGMSQWALNPWKIDYWITGATQSVPVTNTVTFSGHIPPDNTVGVLYRTTSPLISKGDYNQRIYYFIVTNTDGDGFVETTDGDYSWHTGSFTAGDYWVYVAAADIGGNVVSDSMYVTVAGATNPDINLPETAHDFGPLPPGSTAVWPMRIANLGSHWLSVREIIPSNPVFTVDRSHLFVPPGGGEAIVNVSFTPVLPQQYLGSLQVKSNDADEPNLQVSLQGRGLDPAGVADAGSGSVSGIRSIRTLPGGAIEIEAVFGRPGTATLEVVDVSGRCVYGNSAPSSSAAGTTVWRWDGRDEQGRSMPSGIYFVRIRMDGRSSARSALLIR